MLSRLIRAAVIPAVFVAALFIALVPRPAVGDELATTRRAGDVGIYKVNCHDVESMTEVAKSGGGMEIWAVLIEQRKCHVNPRGMTGRLIKWIDGPFTHQISRNVGSVWQALSVSGDTEFIWIKDVGGPHSARREFST